jgi:hypothetical protein
LEEDEMRLDGNMKERRKMGLTEKAVKISSSWPNESAAEIREPRLGSPRGFAASS